MRTGLKLAALAAGISFMSMSVAQAVEIEYWQYAYETRVEAMTQLIAQFEAENPDITVKQTTFPYDDYQTRIVAAKLAGQGPDVMQLYYGWLDKFVSGQLLQPLDPAVFPHDEIESEFFPIVAAMKRGDDYYGLPTAVRSLALFYNKDIFEAAGLDPNSPPQTLDDLVADAVATTQTDDAGNIISEGITLDMAGQDHHWWREVLDRQYGGVPYNDDYTQVTYNDEAGLQALKFYTDLQSVHKVGTLDFMQEGQAAFRAGKAAMTIDGTFRLGTFASNEFNWGVTELPANADGTRSNFASYFANGISSSTSGEELAASEKFLQYVSSPEAMKIWLDVVGELPARSSAAMTDENLADPIYAPFLKALAYAHTTLFVDESGQRQAAVDMVNRVLIEGQDPAASLAQAAADEQAVIDDALE